MAGGNFGGGSGTALDPYLVEDRYDLDAVRHNLAAHYKQTKNIALSGEWLPIGGMEGLLEEPYRIEYPFTGSYDGDHYRITGLQVTVIRYDETGNEIPCSGLFGYALDATLKNIRVSNPEIYGFVGNGPVFGYAVNCAIENCRSIGGTSEGELLGNDATGGLGGDASFGSRLIRCYTTTAVTGCQAGGLIGGADDMAIDDCYSAGTVTTTCPECPFTHGMIGWRDDVVVTPPVMTNCFYDSDVSGYSDNDGHGIPKSTAQMKTQGTYTGWDFDDQWAMPSDGYPVLQVLPPSPVAISGPAQARSAHPTVQFICPDGHGYPLHFRVTSYADEELTEEIEQLDSSVLANPFMYSRDNGLTWNDYPVAGLTEYGVLVRCAIEVGPRRQAWIKVDAGYDDAE